MHRSGGTIPAGITADQLGIAVEAHGRGTAVVSAYLVLERAIANASQHNQAAWRDHRDQLAAEGAPDAALATIDALVPDAHRAGRTLAAVADADGLRHVSCHPQELEADVVRLEPLPALSPLVRMLQEDVPHVAARVDRAAAEIDAVVGRRHRAHDRHPAEPPDGRIRRSAPGGWSQRRYQQRAENLWAEHGHEFAQALVAAADDVDARFVALAGDVRAVQMTCDALPDRVRRLVREVPGSRHADGGDEQFAAAVDELVREVSEADSVTALAMLAREMGEEDRAAAGVPAVFAALSRAQVDSLLLTADADDGRVAWFGDAPAAVAVAEETLADLGVSVPMRGRAVDVAVGAALGTGAAVRVVPAGSLADGFAAILRYGERPM